MPLMPRLRYLIWDSKHTRYLPPFLSKTPEVIELHFHLNIRKTIETGQALWPEAVLAACAVLLPNLLTLNISGYLYIENVEKAFLDLLRSSNTLRNVRLPRLCPTPTILRQPFQSPMIISMQSDPIMLQSFLVTMWRQSKWFDRPDSRPVPGSFQNWRPFSCCPCSHYSCRFPEDFEDFWTPISNAYLRQGNTAVNQHGDEMEKSFKFHFESDVRLWNSQWNWPLPRCHGTGALVLCPFHSWNQHYQPTTTPYYRWRLS